jgi:hypothetical protein
VADGIYSAGGRASLDLWTNRVTLTKRLTLRSLHGPDKAIIDGGSEARCAYLSNGSILSGFTLTNGNSGGIGSKGGGALSEAWGILTNCVLTGNGAFTGGGVYGGTLYRCRLEHNGAAFEGGAASAVLYGCLVNSNSASGFYKAGGSGGGAGGCTLFNCVLTGNRAGGWAGGLPSGGSAFGCTLYNCVVASNGTGDDGIADSGVAACALNNCILAFNSARSSTQTANYDPSNTYNYTCATPKPPGIGNIDADPGFVDLAGGDFHLRYGSPCIDAGTNLIALINVDLDGAPRPLDGNGDGIAAFDIGPYEFYTARVVEIPDSGLRDAIRLALRKSGDDITVADLASLTTLDASQSARGSGTPPISSFEGIQAAQNLTRLDLSGLANQPNLILTDFAPLAQLTHLTTLNLANNQLPSLSLPDGLINLAALDLSGNLLTNLTLPADMLNLTTLDLQNTPLAQLLLPEPAVERLQPILQALVNQGVTVIPYPTEVRLVLVRTSDPGTIGLMVTGPPGSYRVQVSNDLVYWTDHNKVIEPNLLFTESAGPAGSWAFYRARTE